MAATSVAIAAFPGVEELDAIGPYETFSVAREAGADLEVSLRTLEPADRVTCAHGLVVEPDGELPGGADLIVVPGGGWNDGAGGVRAAVEAGDLPRAIADWHDAGRTIAAVCTGAMALASAGILAGRPAVTHASSLADLWATDAEVVDARVVDDGSVLTAGGVTSGIDLSLWLLEREFGRELAEDVGRTLEYERGAVHEG